MLLNVQELVARRLPVQMKGSLKAAEVFRGNTEYVPLSPVDYMLTAQPADDLVIVSGTVSCNVRTQCSRCLEPIEEQLTIPFEVKLRQVSDPEAEFDDEDEAIPVTGERIDLEPFLVEELIVQLPYAPLCGEDCQGLCPECGTNRNEQSCGCNTAKVDPRLAALQDWFKPQQE